MVHSAFETEVPAVSLTLLPGSIVAMTDQAADRLLRLDNGDAALLYLYLLRKGSPDGLSWPQPRLDAALSALKTIPNVAGSVLNAVVAGFFVAALGESVIALSEALYLGKVDRDKISSAVDFVSEKLTSNPAIGFGIKYLESHSDKLQGKSAKEIFNSVQKALKDTAKALKK